VRIEKRRLGRSKAFRKKNGPALVHFGDIGAEEVMNLWDYIFTSWDYILVILQDIGIQFSNFILKTFFQRDVLHLTLNFKDQHISKYL
jgi:hypothetical protein